MLWELTAYNTESCYSNDIRYRSYTTSERKAKAFNQIPKIQFTDSGHGIAFMAWPAKNRSKPLINHLAEYVQKSLRDIAGAAR